MNPADDLVVRALICRTGNIDWGIAETAVLEVTTRVAVTRIPRTRSAIRGLGNFRGLVLPVVDSRVLLGQTAVKDQAAVILVDTGGHRVALEVDEVYDIKTIPLDALTPGFSGNGVAQAAVLGNFEFQGTALLLDFAVLLEPLFAGADERNP